MKRIYYCNVPRGFHAAVITTPYICMLKGGEEGGDALSKLGTQNDRIKYTVARR